MDLGTLTLASFRVKLSTMGGGIGIWALLDGQVTSIANVPRGKACGCRCPGCNEPVLAKKGAKVAHHFAHAGGANCSAESRLHRIAKLLVASHKRIAAPLLTLNPGAPPGPVLSVGPLATLSFESAEVEKAIGDVRPDVVGRMHDRIIAIEIRVTHAVDDAKARALSKAGIESLEVDLSNFALTDFTSEEELVEAVVCQAPRFWVSHNLMNDAEQIQEAYELDQQRIAKEAAEARRVREMEERKLQEELERKEARDRQQKIAAERDLEDKIVLALMSTRRLSVPDIESSDILHYHGRFVYKDVCFHGASDLGKWQGFRGVEFSRNHRSMLLILGSLRDLEERKEEILYFGDLNYQSVAFLGYRAGDEVDVVLSRKLFWLRFRPISERVRKALLTCGTGRLARRDLSKFGLYTNTLCVDLDGDQTWPTTTAVVTYGLARALNQYQNSRCRTRWNGRFVGMSPLRKIVSAAGAFPYVLVTHVEDLSTRELSGFSIAAEGFERTAQQWPSELTESIPDILKHFEQ